MGEKIKPTLRAKRDEEPLPVEYIVNFHYVDCVTRARFVQECHRTLKCPKLPRQELQRWYEKITIIWRKCGRVCVQSMSDFLVPYR